MLFQCDRNTGAKKQIAQKQLLQFLLFVRVLCTIKSVVELLSTSVFVDLLEDQFFFPVASQLKAPNIFMGINVC